MTYIKEGVVYDGNNYWCLSDLAPKNAIVSCSEKGWKREGDLANKEQAKSATVSESEFSLGGIKLGDDESTIRAKLGEPNRVVNPEFGEPELEYSGLTIILDQENRRAIGMKSTSDRYCTPAGLCPTFRFSELANIYGKPEETKRDEGNFFEYYSSGSTCWLQIAIGDSNRVDSIAVACQP